LLGGALFAGGFTYVSPDQFSFAESVVFLTMVLLGGAAAPAGAVLGTGLLIPLPEWLRFLKVIYLAVYGGLSRCWAPMEPAKARPCG
jgi:branched-chain amino acid transport system permease protein